MSFEQEKRTIVFVTISMSGGGTERVIASLANYYVESGYDVHIYMIGGNAIEYKLNSDIVIRQLAVPTAGDFRARIDRIIAIRETIRPLNNPLVIAMGTVAAMFTLLALIGIKCKVVISERNDPNRLNHRPIKQYEKFIRNMLYTRADKIVFQTDMAMHCFPAYLTRKSVIIPNPLPKDIPQYDSLCERQNRIIYVGRLTEQKNPELLLDAFFEISKSYPDYRLEFYGEGELEEILADKIHNYQLEEKAFICGYHEEIYDVMQKSKIYVSCSDWEGISNSLNEAVAMGMYVVATDCPMGGSRLTLESVKYGYLVPTKSLEHLCEAIIAIIESNLQINDDSVEQFREKLSIEEISRKWLE